MINYGYVRTVRGTIRQVESKIEEGLSHIGFSVVTRVDMQEKFKEKLNIEYKKYILLGVCSPANAYKAINAEENIGLLLPCNIVIYENGTQINIAMVKPTVTMSVVVNEDLSQMANHVEKELKSVIDKI